MVDRARAVADEAGATKPRRGRRRDPSIDARVTEAAIEAYAELGWAGFTLDEVARRARVGKAALYLRWQSKEDLLLDSLSGVRVGRVQPPPYRDLRTELTDLAQSLFGFYCSARGLAYLRLYVESRFMPALEKRWRAEHATPLFRDTRGLVRTAIERGELPAQTSAAVVTDALVGAISNHVLATPPDLHDQMIKRSKAYLDGLVDLIIAGAQAAAGPSGKPARATRKAAAPASGTRRRVAR